MTERTEVPFVDFPRATRRPKRGQFLAAKARAKAGRSVVSGYGATTEQPEAATDEMLCVSPGRIDCYKRAGMLGDTSKHLAEVFVVEMVQEQIGDVEMTFSITRPVGWS